MVIAATYTWTGGSADWGASSDWSTSSVPNGTSVAVQIGTTLHASPTVTIGMSSTKSFSAGTVNLANSAVLEIVSAGSLSINGAGTLGLASGTSLLMQGGKLDGSASTSNYAISLAAGGTITGYGTILAGAGGNGSNASKGYIGNAAGAGTIIASGGTLDITASFLQGTASEPTLEVSRSGSGAELLLERHSNSKGADASDIDKNETIQFVGSGGAAEIAFAQGVLGTIAATTSISSSTTATGPTLNNLQAGDKILLSGETITAVRWGTGSSSAHILQVIGNYSGGTSIEQDFALTGTSATDSYTRNGTVTGEIDVSCYVRGTRVRTEKGEVPVEDLRIGDRVVTLSGDLQPVRWIGRRTYVTALIPAEERAKQIPVRIAKGALGDGLPQRDLLVSPEHAVLVDGVLIPAGLLVNGNSIAFCDALELIEYFHPELPAHDVIFAEGAPAETYLDTGNRNMFDNAEEYVELYGLGDPTLPVPCRKLVTEGPQLEAARRRLLAVAEDGEDGFPAFAAEFVSGPSLGFGGMSVTL